MATADTAETAGLTPPEAPPATPWQKIQHNFAALSQRQKLAGAAAIAIAVAMLVGLYLWTREPAYSVLFSNLDERDGGDIIAALQQQNVPYRFTPGGGAIEVPTAQVHEARLRLAAQGLPKGGMVGFELMENEKIGLSQFHEQVNYQRALEGELARTIQSISSVAAARVHLAIPKQTAFLKNDQEPTASVLVTLRGGRFLDENQIAGIRHLISSSVPRLSNENVNIVDQSGNLLTRKPDPLRSAGLDPNQLQYVQEVEDSYIRRIDNILTPMLGAGNFRAQVAADIDFNQTEQTAELYKPNPSPDQAIRSQQTTESVSREAGPQGVPGALTNQPPVPATAPVTTPAVAGSSGAAQAPTTSTRNATINYELDRTLQHVKQAVGQVKRLSVAVVVNHRTETQNGKPADVPVNDAELQRIQDLVKEAMGFNPSRGDSVNVATSAFQPAAPTPGEPLWKNPEVQDLAFQGSKYLVALLALLLVYLAVIRPLMRTVLPPPPKEAKGEEGAGEEGEDAMQGEGEEEGATVSLSPAALAGMSFDDRLAWARQLARDNPKLVANLIREWMGTKEEGGRK